MRTEITSEAGAGLPLVITEAGMRAAINASHDGLQLLITQIAVGAGLWVPDKTATGLQNEIKRLDNLGAIEGAPGLLHITITDDSADGYKLGEFGLYTDTGVLFAVYSQPDVISEKIAQTALLLSADIKIDCVPPGSVTVSGPGFVYPPATESVAGVAEIATQVEVQAGTDSARIVTPATLNERMGPAEHRFLLSQNQELSLDAQGLLTGWNVHVEVSCELVETIITDKWIRPPEQVALLREIQGDVGFDIRADHYYLVPFNVVRFSWQTNSAHYQWLAYPKPVGYETGSSAAIPTNQSLTIGGFVKVLSGSLAEGPHWASGAQVGKWTFCTCYMPRQDLFGAYVHCPPYRTSEKGELLVALPGVITGRVENPEEWFACTTH